MSTLSPETIAAFEALQVVSGRSTKVPTNEALERLQAYIVRRVRQGPLKSHPELLEHCAEEVLVSCVRWCRAETAPGFSSFVSKAAFNRASNMLRARPDLRLRAREAPEPGEDPFDQLVSEEPDAERHLEARLDYELLRTRVKHRIILSVTKGQVTRTVRFLEHTLAPDSRPHLATKLDKDAYQQDVSVGAKYAGEAVESFAVLPWLDPHELDMARKLVSAGRRKRVTDTRVADDDAGTEEES